MISRRGDPAPRPVAPEPCPPEAVCRDPPPCHSTYSPHLLTPRHRHQSVHNNLTAHLGESDQRSKIPT